MSSRDQPIVAFPRPLELRLSRLTSYLENRATLFRWTKFIEQFIESFNHQEVQEAVLTKVGRRIQAQQESIARKCRKARCLCKKLYFFFFICFGVSNAGLHRAQNHLPFGFELSPTQPKWNHSMGH